MKKKVLIISVIVFLIAAIPLLFMRNVFSFELDYFVDEKLYSTDMYSIESNRKFTQKSNKYLFDTAEQGNYTITVQSNANDKSKVVLDFVNCEGYDLLPVRFSMDIDIKINTETKIAEIEVKENYSKLSKNFTAKIEDGQYIIHWTNA